jgi:hypothetical protein
MANAYRAARAQVEALAAPIPQTWDYIFSEYQELKREEEEQDARWSALHAKAEEVIAQRIGARPDRARASVLEAWWRQRDAIANEVAPEMDRLAHQLDHLRTLMSPLATLLVATPAPDHAALLFKMNLVWGTDMEGDDRTHGDGIPIEEIRATLTDARRLLSAEA